MDSSCPSPCRQYPSCLSKSDTGMDKHDKLGYRLGLILTRLNNGESIAVRELSEEFNVCEKPFAGTSLSDLPIWVLYARPGGIGYLREFWGNAVIPICAISPGFWVLKICSLAGMTVYSIFYWETQRITLFWLNNVPMKIVVRLCPLWTPFLMPYVTEKDQLLV